MNNITTVRDERQQIYNSIIDGNNKPKRVLVTGLIMYEAALSYAKYDIRKGQFDLSNIEQVLSKLHNDFISDTLLCTGPSRDIIQHSILKSRAFVMGSGGVIQHPEVHSLEPNEYDRFIEDPYKTIIEVCLPRIYEALASGKYESMMAFSESYRSLQLKNAECSAATKLISNQHGYINMGGGGFTEAPFDFLSDLLRSFSGISADIRRCPQKVKEACNAVIPMMKYGMVKDKVHPYNYVNIPLHMAPYMNRRQFDELYWPSFKELVEYGVKAGQLIHLFVENDWSRYLNDLTGLQGRLILRYEYGDLKEITSANNGKHVLSGLYPAVMLQTNSKKQCIDKAKEILDVAASDNAYIFNFDKTLFTLDETTADNLRAVLEYVIINGKY